MNKMRRNDIADSINKINLVIKQLEKILSDEEDYYDNIPENLQSSLRAEDSENAIDILNEAIDNLKEITDDLIQI